ncbi:MAG: hypothetical protein R3B47_06670 [Bacteroidia bacterium]
MEGLKLGNCVSGDCNNGQGEMDFRSSMLQWARAMTSYQGAFQNGLPQGQGTAYFHRWESHTAQPRYVGTFSEGKMTGSGIRYHGAGGYTKGNFVDGETADGPIEYKNVDGVTFKGQRKNKRWTGAFTITDTEGNTASGSYLNGVNQGRWTARQGGKDFVFQFDNRGELRSINGQSVSNIHSGTWLVVRTTTFLVDGQHSKFPELAYTLITVRGCQVKFDVDDFQFKKFIGRYLDDAVTSLTHIHDADPDMDLRKFFIENYPNYPIRTGTTRVVDCIGESGLEVPFWWGE